MVPNYHVMITWANIVMFWLDFTHYADTSDCLLFSFLSLPYTEAHVQYRSDTESCMIQSWGWLVYNINLRATTTTILSIWGVTIPIDLVSSTMDSIRRHVALFKLVPIPTSDPKSEFLCQSSLIAQNLQTPWIHLVRLRYLPHPHHHVSPVLS